MENRKGAELNVLMQVQPTLRDESRKKYIGPRSCDQEGLSHREVEASLPRSLLKQPLLAQNPNQAITLTVSSD